MALITGLEIVIGAAGFSVAFGVDVLWPPVQQALLPGCLQSQGPSLVTQILPFLPTALVLWMPVTGRWLTLGIPFCSLLVS